MKPTTLDNYRTAAEIHVIPRLGGVALADLSAELVDRLYRELERHGKRAGSCRTAGLTCRSSDCQPGRHEGLSPRPVRHVHTMLRKALQDAVDRGYLGRNVADLANPPTQRAAASAGARDTVWTTDQLRAFLVAPAEYRLGPRWQLLATTGLRRAEVLGLRWSDLDLERGRLRVVRTVTEVRGRLVIQQDGKTDAAQRSLALDARTVEALRRWKVWQAEERLDPTTELRPSGSSSPARTAKAPSETGVLDVHRDDRPARAPSHRRPRATPLLRDRRTAGRRVPGGGVQAARALVGGHHPQPLRPRVRAGRPGRRGPHGEGQLRTLSERRAKPGP